MHGWGMADGKAGRQAGGQRLQSAVFAKQDHPRNNSERTDGMQEGRKEGRKVDRQADWQADRKKISQSGRQAGRQRKASRQAGRHLGPMQHERSTDFFLPTMAKALPPA